MMPAPEMLESALALAKGGFLVFPLSPRSKLPLPRSRGFYDASGNAAIISRWFGRIPHNIGVRTGAASRFWVLDEDEPGALDALEARHGKLPVTRTVRTARGVHLWWRVGSVPIPSSQGKIAPGLDARGDGGYVLAPPSVHPDGPVYAWGNDAPLVEAPEWLVERAVGKVASTISERAIVLQRRPGGVCKASSYGRAALDREITRLAQTANGARNAQLNRAAFSLHQLVAGGALDASEVVQRLVEACHANGLAADANSGGLPQVLRTIRSGARAGLKNPRSAKGRAAQ